MYQTVSVVTSISLTITEQLNSTSQKLCKSLQCDTVSYKHCKFASSIVFRPCRSGEPTYMLLDGHTEGNHSRGRPKKRWLDSVAEDFTRHLRIPTDLQTIDPHWRTMIRNWEVGAADSSTSPWH